MMRASRILILSLALIVGVVGTAQAALFVCTPTKVAVFSNRLHAECTTTTTDGGQTIRFWAVPTTDAAFANRFLTAVSSAIVAGRQVELNFTSGDTSGTGFGCQAGDCRRLQSFVLR
jgi:hypothetical protein